jgi:hypothetical protein
MLKAGVRIVRERVSLGGGPSADVTPPDTPLGNRTIVQVNVVLISDRIVRPEVVGLSRTPVGGSLTGVEQCR